jgi:hypothetical protein
MNRLKNIAENRFAACTNGARLLTFLPDAARRATAGRFSFTFQFSAGNSFRDYSVPTANKNSFTRCEIFRGKVSRRKNQKPKNTSTNGRHRATKNYD